MEKFQKSNENFPIVKLKKFEVHSQITNFFFISTKNSVKNLIKENLFNSAGLNKIVLRKLFVIRLVHKKNSF